MLRKCLLSLILVLALAVPCVMAEESFSILDFYAANKLDQLLTQPGDILTQHGNTYDENGECLTDYYHYLWLDENGELRYAYLDTHITEVYSGTCSYGYSFDADVPYAVAFLGDTYAKDLEGKRNTMPLSLIGDYEHDDELISSNEVKDNVRTVTLAGPYTSEDGSEWTLESVQSMEADTLHILSDSSTFYDQDGKLISSSISTFQLNGEPFTPDARILEAQNVTDTRTATFVFDAGTEKETTQVFTIPRNAGLYPVLPEGYTTYDDAECTVPHQPTVPDADGNYPAELTYYVGPAAE